MADCAGEHGGGLSWVLSRFGFGKGAVSVDSVGASNEASVWDSLAPMEPGAWRGFARHHSAPLRRIREIVCITELSMQLLNPKISDEDSFSLPRHLLRAQGRDARKCGGTAGHRPDDHSGALGGLVLLSLEGVRGLEQALHVALVEDEFIWLGA